MLIVAVIVINNQHLIMSTMQSIVNLWFCIRRPYVFVTGLFFCFLSDQAMDEMNGKELGGEEIEIVLAKPPDKKRKERQAARQTTRNSG